MSVNTDNSIYDKDWDLQNTTYQTFKDLESGTINPQDIQNLIDEMTSGGVSGNGLIGDFLEIQGGEGNWYDNATVAKNTSFEQFMLELYNPSQPGMQSPSLAAALESGDVSKVKEVITTEIKNGSFQKLVSDFFGVTQINPNP